MHKYLIMGAQGCGKGTQAKLLAKDFDLVHINVGQIFRWNIEVHTKLGSRLQRIVAAGQLISDEIVEEIVQNRLAEHDWNYGFILDGFPRNRSQAEFFLESYDIDAVINISVSDQIALQRALSRRVCNQCGLDYNLIFNKPAVANTCDVCGGKLVPRSDDTTEIIRTRLETYHIRTEPVLELFDDKELVINVDGAPPPDEVQKAIRAQLNLP